MSSSRTLLRKLRTSFTCIKPRFDPSIILLYIAASVEQYCDITQVNALPQNEGILELSELIFSLDGTTSDEKSVKQAMDILKAVDKTTAPAELKVNIPDVDGLRDQPPSGNASSAA